MFKKRYRHPMEKAIFTIEDAFAEILHHLRHGHVEESKEQIDEISLLSQDFYRRHVLLEYQLRQLREQASVREKATGS